MGGEQNYFKCQGESGKVAGILFILCAEIFSTAVRSNPKIKGIKIAGDTHKIIQFADDTVLTLLYEENTLQETYNLLQHFSIVSNLTINIKKKYETWSNKTLATDSITTV